VSTPEPPASLPAVPSLGPLPDGVGAGVTPRGVPAGYGEQLEPQLAEALHKVLLDAPGQLGTSYAALVGHPSAGPSELLAHTDVANVGALSNRLAVVRAVLNRVTPGGPTLAGQVAASVRVLLRSATDPSVKAHLALVIADLEVVQGDVRAAQAEVVQLETKSAELEAKTATTLRGASGVYVYTYPHYWRYPYVPGSEQRLLKVGRTDRGAWTRVRDQARSTGAPETPLLLRVYVGRDSTAVEAQFHRLLDTAGHPRSEGGAAGREWFATHLAFLDEIARALELEVLAAELDGF
jgi:hypothetical protein